LNFVQQNAEEVKANPSKFFPWNVKF